jgi:hypothetical protein
MNTQTSNKAGFANNFWVQMAALVVVTVGILRSRQNTFGSHTNEVASKKAASSSCN